MIPQAASTGLWDIMLPIKTNEALTYYLFHHNVLNEFNEEYIFLQGYSMDRPSCIITKLVNKNNPLVRVGGNATILTKGEIY